MNAMSVRVGIVSFAHVHAPPYAEVLASLDCAHFTGISDEDASRGREAAERYGVSFFEDAQEFFEAVDAVVICSENKNHARDAIAALEGGVHVLCEKPISTSVEDAQAMIRTSQETGRQLRVAFPVRYLPAIRQAREIVRSGGVGRILAVNATNHGQKPGGWFVDPDLAGGGAVMDHTVHVADALRWMLGAEAKRVYCEVGTYFGGGGGFGGGAVEDGAILTLEMEGGVIAEGVADGLFATIDPSWSRGEGYPTWGDVTLRITGTSGVLNVDAFARHLTTFEHEEGKVIWSHTGEDMNELMLEDFVRGIVEGSPAGASGEDGLRVLEIVVAAYRSGEDHEPKEVELTEV
jgi:UDP-N-acetylglucosamine 3-dehydrogenase